MPKSPRIVPGSASQPADSNHAGTDGEVRVVVDHRRFPRASVDSHGNDAGQLDDLDPSFVVDPQQCMVRLDTGIVEADRCVTGATDQVTAGRE